MEEVFTDDMTLYIENLKEFTIKPLELIQDLYQLGGYKVAGYKINIQKSIVYLYASNEQSAKEI